MASLRNLSKNVPYLGQQFSALLGNTSLSVKIISAIIFFTYFLSFSEDAIKFLSVTPGYILPPSFWIWTACTYCFLEIHFWEVIVDSVTIGLCGKLIEPLWGQLELLVFFAIVNIGVGVVSASFYLFLYMFTFNTDLLFYVHIHGLAGFIAGLSVAVKQIMPDHVIVKTPLGKITNRNIPLLLVIVSFIMYLCGMLEGTYPTMLTAGLLVSWTYLRFYQRHSNGTRGDLADNFTFASFFPTVSQPPISLVANAIHGGLVRIGLCRRTVRKFDLAAAPTGVTVTLSGDLHDMERRRQIALKALNERLSKDQVPLLKPKETIVPVPAMPPPPPVTPPNQTTVQVHNVIDT
ncbi:unnamed protein product [Nezara viridula]|uniref:Transmembrane protein 115 n=1 Tax=Nezara viridula TaxID=85310 RepID=A0A9P0EA21_NEZVI|nr:unnamed protein product [Nezara viridula]